MIVRDRSAAELVHLAGRDALTRLLDRRAFAARLAGSASGWQRTGYPAGLAGDELPEGARIIAIADAFDATTSERAYQPVRTTGEAPAGIGRELPGAGTQLRAALRVEPALHLDAPRGLTPV